MTVPGPAGDASLCVEIDAGNTRIKWRARRRGAVAFRGGWSSVAEVQGWRPPQPVNAVAMVSVRSDAETAELTASIGRWFPGSVAVAGICDGALGLRCGYARPEQLGCDRWVAMLGALQHQAPPLIVIDAGTAITVDLIAADRVHCGGFILPGYGRSREALVASTARVRPTGAHPQACTSPGVDTGSCVDRGIRLMVSGGVDKLLGARPGYAPCLTGGDAELLYSDLAPASQVGARVIPDLVFDGLGAAVPSARNRVD